MAFWSVFWLAVGLTAVSYLLMPKPKQASPAAAEKFEAPTVQEGESIPVLFGTRRIKAAAVVWYGDIKTVPIKSSGGGKK